MIDIHIHKKYPKRAFDKEYSYGVHYDDSTCILGIHGYSGAGKSTFLKLIAGIESPDSGKIVIGNKVWFDSSTNTNLPIQKREIGYVFQDYALFPNMTVEQNIKYGGGVFDESVYEIFDIKHLLNQKINKLSGGQQQRVAMLRCLFSLPKTILLDEPFSAIDETRKKIIANWLKKYVTEHKITTFLVSHNLQDITDFCDSHIKIENGSCTDSTI